MTSREVNLKLKSLSFPVEFDHVPVGTDTPFGEYTFSVEPVSADNSVLVKGFSYELRVYLTKLSSTIDAEIEKALSDLEIVWTRPEPTYIEDSDAFEIIYQFGFIGES